MGTAVCAKVSAGLEASISAASCEELTKTFAGLPVKERSRLSSIFLELANSNSKAQMRAQEKRDHLRSTVARGRSATAEAVKHTSPDDYVPFDWCMNPFSGKGGFPFRPMLNMSDYAPPSGLEVELLALQTEEGSLGCAPFILMKPSGMEVPVDGWPVVLVVPHTGHCKEGALPLLELLAAQGCMAVSMDNRHQGERARPPPSPVEQSSFKRHCDNMVGAAFRAKRDGSGAEQPYIYDTVWDLLCLVDYLCTLPDVNAGRIYNYGESLGGTIVTYHAAVDVRVQACLNLIGLQGFGWGFENGESWRARAEKLCAFEALEIPKTQPFTADMACSFYNTLAPGLLSEFDMPQVLPLIAPRSCLCISSRDDAFCPVGGVVSAMIYAQDRCHEMGFDPACLTLDVHVLDPPVPNGHGVSPHMFSLALQFLSKHICA